MFFSKRRSSPARRRTTETSTLLSFPPTRHTTSSRPLTGTETRGRPSDQCGEDEIGRELVSRPTRHWGMVSEQQRLVGVPHLSTDSWWLLLLLLLLRRPEGKERETARKDDHVRNQVRAGRRASQLRKKAKAELDVQEERIFIFFSSRTVTLINEPARKKKSVQGLQNESSSFSFTYPPIA